MVRRALGGDRVGMAMGLGSATAIDGLRARLRHVAFAATRTSATARVGERVSDQLIAENRRLAALLEDRANELRRSRARLIEACDAERRRVERDLHDGAQQRIVALMLALRLARTQLGAEADPVAVATLDRAVSEAKAVLSELRDLARGIHPAILTQAGLAAALGSLAERSPVPAVVHAETDERFSAPVEAAAYFVVSEAIANVAKHASARRIDVRLAVETGRLIVDVVDDGVGGARPDHGSGILGLQDRLVAVAGTLEIESPVGLGTRLRATIPFSGPDNDDQAPAGAVSSSEIAVASGIRA
jgi:signal transduction histidine kinase